MTQTNAIIAYLKDHPKTGITSLEAFKSLGVVSLQSRLNELRCRGYRFRQTMVEVRTRYGKAKVMRYWLKG
jgi:hypothetical protein